MNSEPFVGEWGGEPPVRGFLHRAGRESGSAQQALVLTHGASGNCRGPFLVALADAFAAAGMTVLRYDLPFRQARASGPPSPAWAARDQAGIRQAVMLMKERGAKRVFAGGHSYGGRQTTMWAATEPGGVDALLLTSYPLHPPGRPAQLRTAHFPQLRMPALFVTGTRDPFATIEELQAAVKVIPAPVTILPIEGGGHSLATRANKEDLPRLIVNRFSQLVS